MDQTKLWFEQASPGLLRNKAIRNFLAQYTASEWPEVTKLTLLCGILSLHKAQPGKPYSLAQLRDLIATGQIAVRLEGALPDVSNQLDKLQGQLEDIAGELYEPSKVARPVEPTPLQPAPLQYVINAAPDNPIAPAPFQPTPFREPPVPVVAPAVPAVVPAAAVPAVPAVIARQSHPLPAAARVRRLSNPVIAPLPPAGWREGDDLRTWSPPGIKLSPGRDRSMSGVLAPDGAVYPAWWGDGSDTPLPVPAPAPPARPARPAPRLAYSVQPEPAPLYQDDLVTSRYLQVPGSGYGPQPVQEGPYPAAYPPPQGVSPPVNRGPQPGVHPFAAPHQVQAQLLAPQWQPQQTQQQVLYALQPNGVMTPVIVGSPQQQGMGQPQSQPQSQLQPERRAHKKLNLAAVESRIKAQVAADRDQARQKNQARQRAIQNVFKVAAGPPPLRDTLLAAPPKLHDHPQTPYPPQDVHRTPISAPLAQPHYSSRGGQPHASPSTPSELADNLAANPWTSWFMGAPQPSSAGPAAYALASHAPAAYAPDSLAAPPAPAAYAPATPGLGAYPTAATAPGEHPWAAPGPVYPMATVHPPHVSGPAIMTAPGPMDPSHVYPVGQLQQGSRQIEFQQGDEVAGLMGGTPQAARQVQAAGTGGLGVVGDRARDPYALHMDAHAEAAYVARLDRRDNDMTGHGYAAAAEAQPYENNPSRNRDVGGAPMGWPYSGPDAFQQGVQVAPVTMNRAPVEAQTTTAPQWLGHGTGGVAATRPVLGAQAVGPVIPARYPAGLKWDLDEMTLHSMAQGSVQQRAAGKERRREEAEVKRAAKTWVGDFGHLDSEPRFDFGNAFGHHHQGDAAADQPADPAAFQSEVDGLAARMAQARVDGLASAAEDVSLREAEARLRAALEGIRPQPAQPTQEGMAADRGGWTGSTPSASPGSAVYSPGMTGGTELVAGEVEVATPGTEGIAASLDSPSTEQLLMRSAVASSMGPATDVTWRGDSSPHAAAEDVSPAVRRLYQNQFG